MSVPGGLCPRGVSVQGVSVQGVSIQGVSVQGVSVQGVSVQEGSPPERRPPSSWTEWLTHASENITFQQLRLRAVTINNDFSFDVCFFHITGVRVFEKCEVERVITNGRRVTGVQTSQGTIECKHFVNASGMVSLLKNRTHWPFLLKAPLTFFHLSDILKTKSRMRKLESFWWYRPGDNFQWAKDLGRKSDPAVSVPKQPCEHFYIVTKPLEGVDLMTPSTYWNNWGFTIFE